MPPKMADSALLTHQTKGPIDSAPLLLMLVQGVTAEQMSNELHLDLHHVCCHANTHILENVTAFIGSEQFA